MHKVLDQSAMIVTFYNRSLCTNRSMANVAGKHQRSGDSLKGNGHQHQANQQIAP